MTDLSIIDRVLRMRDRRIKSPDAALRRAIRVMLHDGPVPEQEVIRAARATGASWKEILQACDRLGVKTARGMWMLPGKGAR